MTITAVSRAVAVDRMGLQPVVALRAAAGVTLPVMVGVAVGHPTEGAIAAAGALPAGVAGMTGGFRSRAGLVATTSVGMAVSTFVGGLVAGHLAPTLAALAVWGFTAGLAVTLGREATIVGTQAVVGLVVFGRFPSSVPVSATHAAWVLAGGALQGLLSALVRSPQRFAAERRALGRAYASLAMLAHDVSRPATAAAAAVQEAADLVDRRTGEDADLLRGIADEAARLRLELQSLASFPEVAATEEVTQSTAAWLRRLSQAIRSGTAPPEEDPALPASVERLGHARATSPTGPSGTPVRYVAARGAAVLGQLRAADRLTAALAGVRRFTLPHAVGSGAVMRLPNRAGAGARRLVLTARDTQSPGFRHALRLAVVLPLAEGLSHWLPGQRGYWVTLTALVVLKPDYAATVQRGVGRVVGTWLGVLLTGLVVVAVHPSGAAVTVLVALFAWTSYTTFSASYALYSFAITGLVVLLLAPTSSQALTTVGDRGIDTLAGGVLALLAYAVWPTWEGGATADAQASLLRALADYTDVVLGGYAEPAGYDAGRVGRIAAAVRRARGEAQSSMDRAAAEPARVRSDLREGMGIMAATRRIVLSLHALRTTVEDAQEQVALPEVEAVRTAMVGALRGLAQRDCDAALGLREHQQSLELLARSDPSSLHSRRLAVVAAHLDVLVDSVDTAAHVLCPQ